MKDDQQQQAFDPKSTYGLWPFQAPLDYHYLVVGDENEPAEEVSDDL